MPPLFAAQADLSRLNKHQRCRMMAEVLERTDAALSAHAASQPELFWHFRFIYSALIASCGFNPVCSVGVRIYTSLELQRRLRYTQNMV